MKKNSRVIAVIGLCMVMTGCETNTSHPQEGGGNEVVIYECNERLFARSEAFAAIEAYVPQLAEMGVNVLWLMPIHPRGAMKSVGSPYCVRDFRGIDPAFGTMEDLRSLVNTAHSHGMRVMLDWVANHTAWDNQWVSAHPEWYQEAQTADEKSWGDVTFLDYSRQAVCDTMTACMLYWIDEADIDGFRCDYAHGVPSAFWKTAITALRERKSDVLMLAETSSYPLYNAGFDLLYSWNYLTAIENLYKGTGTFEKLLSTSEAEYRTTPEGKERMRYVTTHDESSSVAPVTVYKSAKGEMSAFCLTIFLGGVPMVYSSQELGSTSKINFFDFKVMDFSKQNATKDAMRALLGAYHASTGVRGGERRTGLLTDKVPYIEYVSGNERLIVVCNTSSEKQEIVWPDGYAGRRVLDLLTNEKIRLEDGTTLAGYEYRVLQ